MMACPFLSPTPFITRAKSSAVAVLILTVASSVTTACSFLASGEPTLFIWAGVVADVVVATLLTAAGAACSITGRVERPKARASERDVIPNFFMLYPPCVFSTDRVQQVSSPDNWQIQNVEKAAKAAFRSCNTLHNTARFTGVARQNRA